MQYLCDVQVHGVRGDVLQFPASWLAIDERIFPMLPIGGRIVRLAEHAMLEGRLVTRGIDVSIASVDPLDELDRLASAIGAAGLHLTTDHRSGKAGAFDRPELGARTPDFTVGARGDATLETYDLRFALDREVDDVDLRDEIASITQLEPFAPLAELALFVTRVAWSQSHDRPATASLTITLDDETRPCVAAWLAAHDFEEIGAAWRRAAGLHEHVLVFERADELGVDEATAFVRAASRPSRPSLPLPVIAPPARPLVALGSSPFQLSAVQQLRVLTDR